MSGDAARTALVVGAASQIGHFLLPRLAAAGWRVVALKRSAPLPPPCADVRVSWTLLGAAPGRRLTGSEAASALIHLAPIATLPGLIEEAAARGVRRLIAFSSTSRFTKADSANPAERQLARTLIESEAVLAQQCASLGVTWTVFRPTLVYGCGQDRNVTTIARFVRRFRFFPIVGEGSGRRQPVHADDLAQACLAALECPATYNRAYDLSGGETLNYREMVDRIFRALGAVPRIVSVPERAFRLVLPLARTVPGYRDMNMEMVTRMNRDMCFDHSDASRDFGFRPRQFDLSEETLAQRTP